MNVQEVLGGGQEVSVNHAALSCHNASSQEPKLLASYLSPNYVNLVLSEVLITLMPLTHPRSICSDPLCRTQRRSSELGIAL